MLLESLDHGQCFKLVRRKDGVNKAVLVTLMHGTKVPSRRKAGVVEMVVVARRAV